MIYLDYAANYPAKKEVLNKLVEEETNFYGNMNSLHKLGQLAKEEYTRIDNEFRKLLNLDQEHEIVYTSSASESNNLAIKGIFNSYFAFGNKILSSEFEHSSTNAALAYLKDQNASIDLIRTKEDGQIDLEDLENKLDSKVILVCLCFVESELGTIQNINKVASIVKKYPHAHLLIDATQGITKFNIDLNLFDLISFTPHKYGGLIGTGILVKRKDVVLTPLIHGGRSNTIYRAGTVPLSLIASSYYATKLAMENKDKNYLYVKELNDFLIDQLKNIKNIHINSFNENPYIVNFSVKGIKGYELVNKFSEKGICISQKSACSIINTPSKVMMAIYHNKQLALESVRVSMSNLTTKDELVTFVKVLKEIINA